MLDDEVSPQYNVVISFGKNPEYDFGIFAKGYRQSANILCENFFSKTGFGDYEAYPIIFLYRHAFELSLKNIIYKAWRISGGSNDTILYHDLLKLTSSVKKLLIKLFPDDLDIRNLIERIMISGKEFTDIDTNSYSYRYPIDPQGNHSTEKNQIVNIEYLYKKMNILLNDLEVLDFGLDIEHDRLQEIYRLLDDSSRE